MNTCGLASDEVIRRARGVAVNVTQPGQLEGGGFVGRDQELAVLRAALHGAAAGHGGLVLVAGLPGIGKTQLVGTFGPVARGPGALGLWGSAWGDGVPPA